MVTSQMLPVRNHGNVERVISRIFDVHTELPKAKKELSFLAKQLTPKIRSGDYAQAIMDLGATICKPKVPSCDICPWENHCDSRKFEIRKKTFLEFDEHFKD